VAQMSRYTQEPRNVTAEGLTLLQINPERAAELRQESQWFGWLFYRHPDGQWVSLRKLDSREIEEAYEQSADMNVLDATPEGGVVLTSKSGVRFG
jgi:hypothetical protein